MSLTVFGGAEVNKRESLIPSVDLIVWMVDVHWIVLKEEGVQ